MSKKTANTEEKILPTIRLRERVDVTIFAEMAEKYPTADEGKGVGYTQGYKFIDFPSNFDFSTMSAECIEQKVRPSEAFAVFMFLLNMMATQNGYWTRYSILTAGVVSTTLCIEPCNIQKIFDFLAGNDYVFFDVEGKRLTAPIAVYTYERIQRRRMESRNRMDAYRNKDKKGEPKATPLTPEELAAQVMFVNDGPANESEPDISPEATVSDDSENYTCNTDIPIEEIPAVPQALPF